MVKWSLVWWSGGPKTKRRLDHGLFDHPTNSVSVPRRGFIVFLREQNEWVRREGCRVSVPRRGFIVFLHVTTLWVNWIALGFSPPKGIHCFSTIPITMGPCEVAYDIVSVPRRGFIVFLRGRRPSVPNHPLKFQSPEGDSLFFYVCQCGHFLLRYYVSVPRRGFIVFLPWEEPLRAQ